MLISVVMRMKMTTGYPDGRSRSSRRWNPPVVRDSISVSDPIPT